VTAPAKPRKPMVVIKARCTEKVRCAAMKVMLDEGGPQVDVFSRFDFGKQVVVGESICFVRRKKNGGGVLPWTWCPCCGGKLVLP
jgi:hypothetical protein